MKKNTIFVIVRVILLYVSIHKITNDLLDIKKPNVKACMKREEQTLLSQFITYTNKRLKKFHNTTA